MPAATAPDMTDEESPASAGVHEVPAETGFQQSAAVPDLEDVFQQHASLVFRTARALTGSSEEAEDIVQTVFLRLLRGDAGALRKNPKGYLYRAAVNLSLDVLRARRRRPFIRDVGDLEASTPAAPGFGTHAYHQLDDALAQLDPPSVEILTLRYVHGYNDAEIARMLGVSRGAMAGRLFRLRRRLKALLHGVPRGEKQ
jgi:RNA polymerase sigma-70 factor (ECF subfamily)